MSNFKQEIEEYITSSAHLSKNHIHPRLQKMFELGGMTAVFTRGEGQYLWDNQGTRYLDLLAGGGVYFMGRNQPAIHQTLTDILSMNLPNLTVVNASVLGGVLAGKLLKLAGPHFGKVVFSNAGSEATEVAIRFARYTTGRRRFIHLEGSFHGRSFGAASLAGFASMKAGMDPMMPTCTPVKVNDIAQLRREIKMGDVAGFIYEPVQGQTGVALDADYLREAEALCRQYGTVMIADEVQTGMGRTGDWFMSTGMGVRPDVMTTSKALSGGAIPVGAVMISEEIYEKVYSKFTSGLIYFSTFAENNVAMASGIATIDFLESVDAPNQARIKGEKFRQGLLKLKEKYDVIDRIEGRGMMITIYFKDSVGNPLLSAQQKAMQWADAGAFAAATHVDLFTRQKILAQIPGPGVNAIKILPPVTVTDEDIAFFLEGFEDTLAGFYSSRGPVVAIASGAVKSTVKQVQAMVPPLFSGMIQADASEKKTAPSLT